MRAGVLGLRRQLPGNGRKPLIGNAATGLFARERQDLRRRARLNHIAPLKYSFLTRLYDPVVRLTTREGRFKPLLVERMRLAEHELALDLGCGTGTLSGALARRYPGAFIVGLDADAGALGIAAPRGDGALASAALVRGLAGALPFRDQSFDAIVSSLVFHHLTRAQKCAALGESKRVLKPKGRLHVADWGPPRNWLSHAGFFLVRLLDGFETTADSVEGALPHLMEEAGFVNVMEDARIGAPLGVISLHHGVKG